MSDANNAFGRRRNYSLTTRLTIYRQDACLSAVRLARSLQQLATFRRDDSASTWREGARKHTKNFANTSHGFDGKRGCQGQNYADPRGQPKLARRPQMSNRSWRSRQAPREGEVPWFPAVSGWLGSGGAVAPGRGEREGRARSWPVDRRRSGVDARLLSCYGDAPSQARRLAVFSLSFVGNVVGSLAMAGAKPLISLSYRLCDRGLRLRSSCAWLASGPVVRSSPGV
jgi:hypothetical protein